MRLVPGARSDPSVPLQERVAIAATFVLGLELMLVLLVLAGSIVPGWSAVAVHSGSMRPAIEVGDVVLVVRDRLPRVNDVVLIAREPGTPLLHRVVAWTDDGRVLTQGDGNAVADSTPVETDRLLGVGRVAIPAIGLPLVWLERGDLAQLTILLAANTVLVGTLISSSRRRRRAEPQVMSGVPLAGPQLRDLHDGLPDWVTWQPDEPLGGRAMTGDRHEPTVELALRRLRVIVAMAVAIGGLDRWSTVARHPWPVAGALAAGACLMAASLLGRSLQRADAAPASAARIVPVQLALDTTAAALVVAALGPDDGVAGWMPLLLPLIEAGFRYRLRGLAIAWVAGTIVQLTSQFVRGRTPDPGTFVSGAGFALLAATAVAYLAEVLFAELVATAVDRHVADRRAVRTEAIASFSAALGDPDEVRIATAAGVAAAAITPGATLWRNQSDGWHRLDGPRASTVAPATDLDAVRDAARRERERGAPDVSLFQHTTGRVHVALTAPDDPDDFEPRDTRASLELLLAVLAAALDAAGRRTHPARCEARAAPDVTARAATQARDEAAGTTDCGAGRPVAAAVTARA